MRLFKKVVIHLKFKKVFNAYKKRFYVMYECKNCWAFYNANAQNSFNANAFNVNAKIILMYKSNYDAWMYEGCKWMQWTDAINFKLMHWMIMQLRHGMHKHNTYINIYKSHNTHKQENKYSGAHAKEIKKGWNDHTNLDNLSLTCCLRYQMEINNKDNTSFKYKQSNTNWIELLLHVWRTLSDSPT